MGVPLPDKKVGIKAFLLRQVKVFALIVLGLVLILGGIGYYGKGWEGALNGAIWGLVLSLFTLPVFALFISAHFWSGYAGRYGEYQYKKQLEGDPEKKDRPEDKW